MKRTVVLYPVFFVLAFLITVDIPLPVAPLIYGLVLALLAALWWGLYRITKDGRRAAFLSTLTMGWLLYCGTASNVVVSRLGLNNRPILYLLLLVPWTLGMLFLATKFFWRKIGSASGVVGYLNLATAAMLLFFGYQVVKIEAHGFLALGEPEVESVPHLSTPAVRPDIYYIILDGYTRQDVLRDLYGYGDDELVSFLSSRGFYVAGQSSSNYMSTDFSLTSSLNMSYLVPLSTGRVARQSINQRLISHSAVRSTLEALGYTTVAFSTPFYFTDITDAAIFLSLKPDRARAAFLEAQLVPRSAAAYLYYGSVVSPGGETYRDHQERLLYMFDELAKVPALPGPKFVFAHIIAPHLPYVFDRNGPVTPDKAYIQRGDTDEQEISGYTGQLAYMTPLVEKAIDVILRSSSSPPIIIVQGDHGGGLYYDPQSMAGNCAKARTAILNAYYLPGLADQPLYDSISPVNSFRVVFNEYFGASFDLLEDKVYYSRGGVDHYRFVDVTGDSEQPCRLP